MNTRRAVGVAAGALAAALAMAPAAGAQPKKEPEPRLDIVIVAAEVADMEEAAAPDAKVWAAAKAVSVPLERQQFVEPFQARSAAESVSVRALRSGGKVALLVEWADKSESAAIGSDRFTDGCGVMLAAGSSPPSVMMGETGKPVRLFNWKAAWQEPGELPASAWVDVVPMSGRAGPVRPDTAVHASPAKANVGGWAVDNPVSGPAFASVVEELAAEGPGSVTHKGFAPGGRGVWKQGRWRVVIVLPDEAVAAQAPAAFAVWNGEQGDVGGKKSISPWVTLRAQ